MSLAAYKWAERQSVSTPTAKLVLFALAGFANEKGFAWPSQEAIAERTGLSVRAIREALKLLEARQLIAREKRGSKKLKTRTSDLILLDIQSNSAPHTGSKCRNAHIGKIRTPYRQDLPTNLSQEPTYPIQDKELTSTGMALGRQVTATAPWNDDAPFDEVAV